MKHTPTPKKLDKEATTRLRSTPCSVVLKVMLLIAKEVGATGVTIASRESEVPQQTDSRQNLPDLLGRHSVQRLVRARQHNRKTCTTKTDGLQNRVIL